MRSQNSDPAARILIVGTGALATLFAVRLAGAGYEIVMLGRWPDGLSALRQRGARLVGARGTEERYPVTVADGPADSPAANLAIVLVKSWQTKRAARDLAACLTQDGVALTLQNGLGNREILAAALGARRVALGSTTTGATLLGPGLAKAGGEGTISLEAHPRLAPLTAAFEKAGFGVEVVQDASSVVWTKLVVNSAINPLTALLRIPNGDLLARPSARALMRLLARETASVAFAERVASVPRNPVRLVESVALRTASNHSSMYQDIQRGAPTEIDAICGAVTRLGRRHKVPTPMNQACWQLVQALTEKPADREMRRR